MSKGIKKVRVARLCYGHLLVDDSVDDKQISKLPFDDPKVFRDCFSPVYQTIFIDSQRKDTYYDVGTALNEFTEEELRIMSKAYDMMMLNKELEIKDKEYYSLRTCCFDVRKYIEEI